MICNDIIKILQERSPESYACEWDNVGLLIGDRKREIKCIYIALDATDAAIDQAIEVKADMLLTHHPLMFRGLQKVISDDFIGRRIIKIIQKNISYYAMHTNFDVMCMADLAAERINLSNTKVLQETFRDVNQVKGIGKVGKLAHEMTLEQCVEIIKDAFHLSRVKLYGDKSQKVEIVAISPGSGKTVVEDAIRANAQVLITGDIGHHEGMDAVARGMSVVDAGHYGLEQIFIPYMEEFLNNKLRDVKMVTQSIQPFQYL
jgi:dinuclear metal center YbgI/SA1388 family protein